MARLANGNMTGYTGATYSYDIQNRMIQASASGGGSVLYGYDSTNHRIYKGAFNGSSYSAEEIYFYGVEGHKYGTWQVNPASGVLLQASVTKQWFGKRLLAPEDHLHSQGKYYAFGEERTGISPANPPDDQEKFATYTRDSATDLDYADQRYYSSIIGRFMRPDPYGGSADSRVPQTWNRYSYVSNDPSNHLDARGLDDVGCCTGNCEGYEDPTCDPYTSGPADDGGSSGPEYSYSLEVGYTPFLNLGNPLNSYDHLFIWLHENDGNDADGVVFDGG